jgi:hypothetical protein
MGDVPLIIPSLMEVTMRKAEAKAKPSDFEVQFFEYLANVEMVKYLAKIIQTPNEFLLRKEAEDTKRTPQEVFRSICDRRSKLLAEVSAFEMKNRRILSKAGQGARSTRLRRHRMMPMRRLRPRLSAAAALRMHGLFYRGPFGPSFMADPQLHLGIAFPAISARRRER